MTRLVAIKPTDLLPPWKFLTQTLGERRAGSRNEHLAAEYLLDRFKRMGLEARLEAFECRTLVASHARLEVKLGAAWRKVPCEVLVHSPSTEPLGRLAERELVWMEMPEQAAALAPGSLRGKALLLFGPLATNTAHHRALVRSGAALVLWVDDRNPYEWPKADAILPVWVRRHGALPTVAVAYRPASEWRRRGVRRIRAMVQTEHATAASYNVVADLPGARGEIVALGSHYDTQCGNPGADDNASGTVTVLALAQAFTRAAKKRRLRRTLRFMSFGTEEQLSVGARAYALAHRREMKRHVLMLNYDSISLPLGHTRMLAAGTAQLERWALKGLERAGLRVALSRAVTPFADHFPFNVYQVPSLWFYRTTNDSGRWLHHSVHDRLGNVSPEEACRIANASALLIAEAATAPRLPFRGMRPADRPLIKRFAKELFDM